jgi:hypothetical protein
MMAAFVFGSVAAFLVVLLVLMNRGDEAKEFASSEPHHQARHESHDSLQPTELAIRIFSRDDREFIALTRSARLQSLYQTERRKVASHWVRRTSREVSMIMHSHRLNSRQSPNLRVSTEAKLFCQYVQLRFLCGLLLFLIQLFSPHALRDLAFYAGKLYQRIGGALPGAAAIDRAVSSGNSATL